VLLTPLDHLHLHSVKGRSVDDRLVGVPHNDPVGLVVLRSAGSI
jgi:hypothetical protein